MIFLHLGMKDLDKKILVINKDLKRKEKIKIHLNNLMDLMQRRSLELENIELQINKEEQDVTRLEKLNLFSTFQFILGNIQQQLEKERQELLQAVLKRNGLIENLKALKKEKEVLEKSFISLHDIELEFEKLLNNKVKLLKQNNKYPPSLNRYNEKLASFDSRIRELKVTIKQGEKAKKELHKIIVNLGKIDNWGYENTPAKIVKVNRQVDRTHKHVYIANNFLQRYEEELLDLSDHFELEYRREVEMLEKFLDQFIDCLITDWIVRSKLENSIHLVLNVIDKITLINAMLEYEIEKTNEYIKEEKKMKTEIIISLITNQK